MDGASQVLAQGVPPGVPNSYRALADQAFTRRRGFLGGAIVDSKLADGVEKECRGKITSIDIRSANILEEMWK